VVGTPGGTTIPTSVFQALVNVIDYKLPPDEAINAPKFHHQWLPDEVMVEPDFPEAVRESMKKMGYKVTVRGFIGRTEAILLTPDGKGGYKLVAVGDKRGDDHADGY
jgi:gamma-glutamyltranspeptidase/glutathione hydrolase